MHTLNANHFYPIRDFPFIEVVDIDSLDVAADLQVVAFQNTELRLGSLQRREPFNAIGSFLIEPQNLRQSRLSALANLSRRGPVDRTGQSHDTVDVVAIIRIEDHFQSLVVSFGLLGLDHVAADFDVVVKPPECLYPATGVNCHCRWGDSVFAVLQQGYGLLTAYLGVYSSSGVHVYVEP